MNQLELGHEEVSGATISGFYRYRLWRRLRPGSDASRCVFIMLNPSTADAFQDDPTIRKCMKFATRWGGFTWLEVVNLFALRATNPKVLKHAGDPVGPENDAWIWRVSQKAEMVICAWGNDGRLLSRDKAVLGMLGDRAHYLKINEKTGCPAHPLYLRDDSIPRRMPVSS